jgi:hypothetical protein
MAQLYGGGLIPANLQELLDLLQKRRALAGSPSAPPTPASDYLTPAQAYARQLFGPPEVFGPPEAGQPAGAPAAAPAGASLVGLTGGPEYSNRTAATADYAANNEAAKAAYAAQVARLRGTAQPAVTARPAPATDFTQGAEGSNAAAFVAGQPGLADAERAAIAQARAAYRGQGDIRKPPAPVPPPAGFNATNAAADAATYDATNAQARAAWAAQSPSASNTFQARPKRRNWANRFGGAQALRALQPTPANAWY